MTQDEIIEMARQAGFSSWVEGELQSPYVDGVDLSGLLKHFAKLVAAKEREACAKLVEVSDALEDWEIICGSDGRELLNAMAAAIRARGEE